METHHFKIIVGIQPLNWAERSITKSIVTNHAIRQFVFVNWRYGAEGRRGDMGQSFTVKTLVFDIGIRSPYGDSSEYKRALHFCEYLRTQFKQPHVHMIMPSGEVFKHTG